MTSTPVQLSETALREGKHDLHALRNIARNPVYIGIGGCGMNMLITWMKYLQSGSCTLAVNRDRNRLTDAEGFDHKLLLSEVAAEDEHGELRTASKRQIASSIKNHLDELSEMVGERNQITLLAGLGGATGSWASQAICNHFIAADKQLVTVLVMPFAFESARVKVADQALTGFDGSAYRVLCFNDYLIKHTHKHTSMVGAFEMMNQKAFELLGFPE